MLHTREIDRDTNAPLTIGERHSKSYKLIQITKDSWDKYDKSKKYWEPDKEGLSLHAADALMPRALRFMGALIKLLQHCGHEFRENQYGYIVAGMDDIEIEVYLREASRRVPWKDGYSRRELVPTGAFIFQIGKYSDQKEWRDVATAIEGLLARIAVTLELLAEKE